MVIVRDWLDEITNFGKICAVEKIPGCKTRLSVNDIMVGIGAIIGSRLLRHRFNEVERTFS